MPSETQLRAAIEELAAEAPAFTFDAGASRPPRVRRLAVAAAVVLVAVVAAVYGVARTSTDAAPAAPRECAHRGTLTLAECRLALRVAHAEAIAAQPGVSSSGWPSKVRAIVVTRFVQHDRAPSTCGGAGPHLGVDLIGDYDYTVSPVLAIGGGASRSARQSKGWDGPGGLFVDVDVASGAVCSRGVTNGYLLEPRGAVVLYRR